MAKMGKEIVTTRRDRPVVRVKRCVDRLRQLQQRIRKRSRGRSALSAAEVRAAVGHGRK